MSDRSMTQERGESRSMTRERRAPGSAVASRARTEGALSWDAAMARSPLAMALVDPDTLDLQYLTDGFRELIGAGLGDSRGQPLPEQLRATLATALETGTTARTTDVAYEHPAFGSVLLDCSAWPFHDPESGQDGLALQVSVQTGGVVKLERVSLLSDQIRAANAQLVRSGIRQLELRAGSPGAFFHRCKKQ